MRFSKTYLWLLLFIFVAFFLRADMLGFFSLRGDESFTVLFVQKPLAQMWEETLTVEPNPPLLYFALRAWIALAGDGEFATRYFSLFFGVLCVPLVYRLARLTLTPDGAPKGRAAFAALVAAFLIAINPYQIWHSQDVRNYTLWPALTLLALFYFWQWYGYKGSHKGLLLLLFTIAELAALYTHYYEAFLLLALNLFVFATSWRDVKKLLPWIGSQLVLAVLYLPYPLILSNRVSSYGEGSGRQGVALWDVVRETITAFTLSDTLDATWRVWLWIPLALLALAGLIVLFTRDWKRGLFFALYAGVPTLAVFALNTIRPLYLERYLNGIAPVYYILLAYAIVELPRLLARGKSQNKSTTPARVLSLALLVGCAVLAGLALLNYWTNPAYAKAPDWRGLASIISANAVPDDIIIQNFPETSLVYYDRSKLPLVVYPETYLPDAETDRALNAMNANYQRAWFIPAAPDYWDPAQYVEGWLDRRTDLLHAWNVGDLRLRLYSTPSQYLNTMNPSDAVLGDVLRLSGYRTSRDGNALRVALYWRVLMPPGKSLTMTVRLLNPDQSVAQEITQIPVRGELPTSEWHKNQLIVDQYDFPDSGDATRVSLSVCDAETKVCLPVSGAMPNTTLTLPILP